MIAWNELPMLVFQVGEELDADQLALGGLGPAFGARAVLGQDDQLVHARLVGFFPSSQASNWRWTCRSG